MALHQRRKFRALTRVAAVMLVGAGLCACSTVPNWVDPTTWMGPDVPDQAQTANGQYPDLSKIPAAPQQTASDDSTAVASSLAQARSDVQYSAQALRGGTEAAAAPPPPAPTKAEIARAEASAPAAAEEDAADNTEEAKPEPKAAKPAPAAPVTRVATAQEPAAPAASAEPAVPAVPSLDTQSSVPGAMPAVPVAGPSGFQASKAPPLDASVAQFVPAPIIARYAQTASVASPAAAGSGAVALKAPRGARQRGVGTGQHDVGGPESMSGAVVANLGSLQAGPGQPSVYASGAGMPPVAVVLFPGDSTGLNAAGRRAVKKAAEAYRARGGRGYVRVVGHSSSRTGNMSLVRHMEINFRKSQARARAVARQLIRQGVPAGKVLIDAVGDSQPVYHESMPRGEDGNRRAEIFLQG